MQAEKRIDPDQLASERSKLIWIYTVIKMGISPGLSCLGLTSCFLVKKTDKNISLKNKH